MAKHTILEPEQLRAAVPVTLGSHPGSGVQSPGSVAQQPSRWDFDRLLDDYTIRATDIASGRRNTVAAEPGSSSARQRDDGAGEQAVTEQERALAAALYGADAKYLQPAGVLEKLRRVCGERKLLCVTAAVVVVACFVGAAVFFGWLPGGGAQVASVGDEAAAVGSETGFGAAENAAAGAAAVTVHVAGEVNTPGVVELASGDRVIDAIAAAGGETGEADLAFLNLAREVGDGEQIIVPSKTETAAASGGAGPAGLSETDAPMTRQPGAGGGGGRKININRADADTLAELPKIGPKLAARIIAWRTENGGFRDVLQLQEVSGIGEKLFAELKDLVVV